MLSLYCQMECVMHFFQTSNIRYTTTITKYLTNKREIYTCCLKSTRASKSQRLPTNSVVPFCIWDEPAIGSVIRKCAVLAIIGIIHEHRVSHAYHTKTTQIHFSFYAVNLMANMLEHDRLNLRKYYFSTPAQWTNA